MAGRKRKTRRSAAGRTASGKIKKGWRLTKGGRLVKTRKRRR